VGTGTIENEARVSRISPLGLRRGHSERLFQRKANVYQERHLRVGYGGIWCLVVEVLARPVGSGVVGRAAVVWDALFFCGISLLEMLLEYDTILRALNGPE